MVDRSFSAALRNFSTLFLLVATITVPLHLIYAVVFQNVIETRELHAVIETFPEARQVRSVGRAQLTQARLSLGVLTVIEIAALPFLASGARRVIRLQESGGVPTVGDALRAIRVERALHLPLDQTGPLIVATVTGLAIGWAIERTGLLLLEFLPDAGTFPFFGLMQATSRAVGAPFLLATLALASRPPRAPNEKIPPLY